MKSNKQQRRCDYCVHFTMRKGVVPKYKGNRMTQVAAEGAFCLKYRNKVESLDRAVKCSQFTDLNAQMLLESE